MSRAGGSAASDRHVYEHRDAYRIGLSGKPRETYKKSTAFLRVPYRTVLGRAMLDLTLLARLPEAEKKGEAMEVALRKRSGLRGVLGELLLLRWHVARDGGLLAKEVVGQPLGVWTYGGGEVVVVCLGGTEGKPLERWLVESRKRADPSLRVRVSRALPEPEIARWGGWWKDVPAWTAAEKRVPVATLHPLWSQAPGAKVRPVETDAITGEAAPKERPPYWAPCEEMSFGGLRGFIDDCLRGSSGPGPEDRPVTRKGFLDLLGLLRAKVDDEPAGGDREAPKVRPIASPLLRSLRAERDWLAREIDGARGKPNLQKRRRRLKLLAQEIARLEAHEDRHRPKGRTQADRLGQMRARRLGIVERVKKDIERAFGPGGTTEMGRLPWRPLPPGELSAETLRRHYAELERRDPRFAYDPARIEKAFSLGPERCYVGTDEFDGYVVFTFPDTEKALLECPIFGNAIYIIDSGWRRYARMSKRELLADRTRGVTRIVHRGDWFARVRRALGKPAKRGRGG